MKTLHKIILLLLLASVAVTACKKEPASTNATISAVNSAIYDLMKDYYLWYDQLPVVDPTTYATPNDLMDALRYKKYDKWSTVLTKTDYNQYFVAGQMVGYGFSLVLDANNKVRIAFLYRGTQAYNQGVRRSWIIDKVNGTAVTKDNVFTLLGPAQAGLNNTISFIKTNGDAVDLSLTKSVVNLTPVLHYEVIQQGAAKVGYIVFQDFIDTARVELDEAFNSFNSQGINELVVDLRYNGGGSVDVARYLAGWLIGKNNGNQPFVNFRHNDKHMNMDTTLNVPSNSSGLSLDRMFFIGTRNTASASELIINGVKPFLSTEVLVGDTTDGKPVGMYAFPFINYDYVVLPISFKYTNARDEGDFYGGLIPNLEAADDVTRDFGDPQETSLKAALDYINGGALPLKSAGAGVIRGSALLTSNRGVGQYLKAY
jgi:carboxyl-terminal processing protease